MLLHPFEGGVFSFRLIMRSLADDVGCPVLSFDRPGAGLVKPFRSPVAVFTIHKLQAAEQRAVVATDNCLKPARSLMAKLSVACRLHGLLAQAPASIHHTRLILHQKLLSLCVSSTTSSTSSLLVRLMALQ